MKKILLDTLVLLTLLGLTACGGGGGGSSSPPPAKSNMVATAAVAAPISNCLYGGIAVTSGIDSNGNGVLDVSEVTSTQYVCNGTPGADGSNGSNGTNGTNGLNVLITHTAEPAGVNCANGGQKISAGQDSNGNSILDTAEITTSAYVCNGLNGSNGTNGSNGSNGANGSNGLNALSAIVTETAGANCANGGLKLTAGLDSNSNSILDAAEVSSTSYVCNGANGSNGTNGTNGLNGLNSLTVNVTESAGTNCTAGGRKLTSGLDSNSNSILDAAEVSSTSYVCNGVNGSNGTNGTNGSNGLNSLSVTVTEAAGANCTTGGLKLTAGLDSNANNILDPLEIISTNYVCNGATGATGPTGPAGPGITWVNVTGTFQQAVANTGYLANNAAQVSINLPANPVIGDIVQVSGAGAGGWRIMQNAGQSIQTKNLPGAVGALWSAHEANRQWDALASSWDGSRLVAAVDNGLLYTSTDSGLTWIPRETARAWRSVASSSDGSKLVAVGIASQIYTSGDYGITWTARDAIRNWNSVASSGDGTKLVATLLSGQIYTSTDSGVTWTARDAIRSWISVASSWDGANLVAAVQNGQLFTSVDSGVTWTARDAVRSWQSVSSSTDGSKLVAAVSGGQIYTSTDFGVTWTPRDSNRGWRAVSSSWDGIKLVAVATGGTDGKIYTSTDSGLTWTPRESLRGWVTVASSWDGGKLVAGVLGGQLYTSVMTAIPSTTLGTAGSVFGLQYDAIALQCIGNNTFTVLNYTGNLAVQ